MNATDGPSKTLRWKRGRPAPSLKEVNGFLSELGYSEHKVYRKRKAVAMADGQRKSSGSSKSISDVSKRASAMYREAKSRGEAMTWKEAQRKAYGATNAKSSPVAQAVGKKHDASDPKNQKFPKVNTDGMLGMIAVHDLSSKGDDTNQEPPSAKRQRK